MLSRIELCQLSKGWRYERWRTELTNYLRQRGVDFDGAGNVIYVRP